MMTVACLGFTTPSERSKSIQFRRRSSESFNPRPTSSSCNFRGRSLATSPTRWYVRKGQRVVFLSSRIHWVAGRPFRRGTRELRTASRPMELHACLTSPRLVDCRGSPRIVRAEPDDTHFGCLVHTWSAPQECGRQVFLDDDVRCFRCQFATDQIKTLGGIEQKRSYVVRREHTLCDKLAHQSLQNENVDFAVSERHCLFDHRDLPDHAGRHVDSRVKP